MQVFWKHKSFGNISQLETRPLIGWGEMHGISEDFEWKTKSRNKRFGGGRCYAKYGESLKWVSRRDDFWCGCGKPPCKPTYGATQKSPKPNPIFRHNFPPNIFFFIISVTRWRTPCKARIHWSFFPSEQCLQLGVLVSESYQKCIWECFFWYLLKSYLRISELK